MIENLPSFSYHPILLSSYHPIFRQLLHFSPVLSIMTDQTSATSPQMSLVRLSIIVVLSVSLTELIGVREGTAA